MNPPFPTLGLGSRGPEVDAAKRSVYRALGVGQLTNHVKKPKVVRETFGIYFRTTVKTLQKRWGIPATGTIGPATWSRLLREACVDEYSKRLLGVGRPIEPVRPFQGWESLDPRLYDAFAIGRSTYGLLDGPGTASGTYNPGSRLPSGKPSKHALRPARAFDLDIITHTGWANLNARRYFMEMVGRPEVENVILGDKIWNRRGGIHAYTAGGHENHVHVDTF